MNATIGMCQQFKVEASFDNRYYAIIGVLSFFHVVLAF